MTGALELEGRRQSGKSWDVTIYIDAYLDGVLHLIEFGEDASPAVVGDMPF